MMIKKIKTVLCSLALCVVSVNASAIVINFGPTSSSANGALITFDNLVTPTTAISDAIITLNVAGDFNSTSENAVVSLDGFSLGTIFNKNGADDAFNFTGDDYSGSSVGGIIDTATATIALADFSGLLADGFLNFSFQASSTVNCCSGTVIDHLSGSISFDAGTVSVSEPGTLSLLGLALLGFAATRRKAQA